MEAADLINKHLPVQLISPETSNITCYSSAHARLMARGIAPLDQTTNVRNRKGLTQ